MGKRSSFTRRPQDAYDTPASAVESLLPHLPNSFDFWEPCAGKGDLIDALHGVGLSILPMDISPRREGLISGDALETKCPEAIDFIITNPPWTRSILHPMIEHFSDMRPTWLLFDADWIHTKQAAPYMPRLRKIVSVGRVKWIPDSKHTGKDNCAWYLFDKPSQSLPVFIGRAA